MHTCIFMFMSYTGVPRIGKIASACLNAFKIEEKLGQNQAPCIAKSSKSMILTG